MPSIVDLISKYPILSNFAFFVSTLDLYNLSRTSRACHLYILSSQPLFQVLKRRCLCDGHGLAKRQAFTGFYSLRKRRYNLRDERHIWQDEPIEVRLYATRCDELGGLPCRKCAVNICEECRYYPREPPHRSYPQRRPHLNLPGKSENVMFLCLECDAKLEKELSGQFLNELCDCDVYTRWICVKCVKGEQRFTWDYYDHHTGFDHDGSTKALEDDPRTRDFYCLCGKPVPDNIRPRCSWCKRKHLPESE